jgi:GT2 family glycosyltransferase
MDEVETLPRVSVVVPTWNRADELRTCLLSIEAQNYPNLEVIVVDDGSTDQTQAMMRDEFPKCKWLSDGLNAGHYIRRNQGIAASTGEFVLSIDSDVIFRDSELIRRLVETANKDSSLGEMGGEFPLHDREHANGHRFTRSWYPKRVRVPKGSTELVDVDYLATCFVFVRRHVLDRAGGFDPYYLFGPADADLGLRIKKLGYRNVVSASLSVEHNASEGGRRSDAAWRYCSARVRIMLKHTGVCRTFLQCVWDMARLLPVYAALLVQKKVTQVEKDGAKFIPRAYWWHLLHVCHTRSMRHRNFLSAEEIEAFLKYRASRRTW